MKYKAEKLNCIAMMRKLKYIAAQGYSVQECDARDDLMKNKSPAPENSQNKNAGNITGVYKNFLSAFTRFLCACHRAHTFYRKLVF